MLRYYYPYDEFRSDMQILVRQIDTQFDAIVAIARGGLCIGHFLAEYFSIRHLFSLNAIGYDDTKKRQDITLLGLPDLQNFRNVLVVDDIVDSGDTLRAVLSALQARYCEIKFSSAVLFYKKEAVIKPTWYVKEPPGWIDFFWSEDLRVGSKQNRL